MEAISTEAMPTPISEIETENSDVIISMIEHHWGQFALSLRLTPEESNPVNQILKNTQIEQAPKEVQKEKGKLIEWLKKLQKTLNIQSNPLETKNLVDILALLNDLEQEASWEELIITLDTIQDIWEGINEFLQSQKTRALVKKIIAPS